MSIALLLALGVAIGLLLGALGGGGAVLAVPALVFLVGQSANAATTSSLFIVGAAAVTGAASHVRSGGVAWRTGLAFGLAGVPAAWAGSQLNQMVPEHVLLIAFGVLMIAAAGGMVRGLRSSKDDAQSSDHAGNRGSHHGADRADGESANGTSRPDGAAVVSDQDGADTQVLERPHSGGRRRGRPSWLAVLGAGLGVGLLTGFFGVGGGFVVVPVLVLALGLPMSRAVGTSLVVVAINSGSALLARAPAAEFDWAVIAPFAGAAVAATLLGRRVSDKLPARQLQITFAVLLVLVAGYTIVRGVMG